MTSSCGCDMNYTPCNETSIPCARDIYYGVMESDIEKKCSECPLECEWTTYGITSSFSYYPNDGRIRSLAKETLFKDQAIDITDLRKRIVSFNVFLEEMKYTTISESAKYSGLDLVSAIGGSMGIFIGSSFLTVAEIFEVIIAIMVSFIKNF